MGKKIGFHLSGVVYYFGLTLYKELFPVFCMCPNQHNISNLLYFLHFAHLVLVIFAICSCSRSSSNLSVVVLVFCVHAQSIYCMHLKSPHCAGLALPIFARCSCSHRLIVVLVVVYQGLALYRVCF